MRTVYLLANFDPVKEIVMQTLLTKSVTASFESHQIFRRVAFGTDLT
jgi:hypothetical protein